MLECVCVCVCGVVFLGVIKIQHWHGGDFYSTTIVDRASLRAASTLDRQVSQQSGWLRSGTDEEEEEKESMCIEPIGKAMHDQSLRE